MKVLILISLIAFISCDWQNGYYANDDGYAGLWGGVREENYWPMVDLND